MNDIAVAGRSISAANESADDSSFNNASTASVTGTSCTAQHQTSSVKLFVGSLPYDVNEDDLLSIFSKFGDIAEFTILRDRTGRSRGCAALRFTGNDAAELCIATLHNRFCCGNVPTPLQVRYFEKREQIPVTCFLECLPYCFSPHVLWTSLSATYGPVSNVYVDAVDPYAAYVSFYKKNSAFALSNDAVAASVHVGGMVCPSVRVTILKPMAAFPQPMMAPYGCYPPMQYEYSGSPLMMPPQVPAVYTVPADSSSDCDPPMKLFVGCLPYSKTAQDIADLFSPFGTLIEVAILTDYSGKSRGAAFVTFGKTSEAKKAVDALTDFSFPKSTRCINISYAYKQTVWNSNPCDNATTASGASSNADDVTTPVCEDKSDSGLVQA